MRRSRDSTPSPVLCSYPLRSLTLGDAQSTGSKRQISWYSITQATEVNGGHDRHRCGPNCTGGGGSGIGNLQGCIGQGEQNRRDDPTSRHGRSRVCGGGVVLGTHRVLLLISESRDRGSETAVEQVAVAAQTAGVAVYAATYSAFKTGFTSKAPPETEPLTLNHPKMPTDETGTVSGGPPECNPVACPDPAMPHPEQRVDVKGGIGELVRLVKTNTSEALTKGTGGAIFPFTRLKGLEEAIRKLGAELHSQYLLSFTPENPASGYHRLEVCVAGGDFRVRARPGYWTLEGPGQ
jgi:hypothetical protein